MKLRSFWLNSGAFALALGLIISSTRVPMPWTDVATGVATSIVVAATLNVSFIVREKLIDNGKSKFFGTELIQGNAILAYPDFEMNDDVSEALCEKNQQLLYKRPRSRFASQSTHRIDIPRVVASNDIRALLYLSPVLSNRLSEGVSIEVDREVLDDPDRSFVSFGLSSNDCTHLYLEVADKPLFSIVEDGQGSEYLGVDSEKFASGEGRQFGIIVRYLPEPRENPERRWFLVAGLGPIGTTAAAYYLAKNWKDLSRSVGRDSNFIAVVKTGVGSEMHGKLVMLRMG